MNKHQIGSKTSTKSLWSSLFFLLLSVSFLTAQSQKQRYIEQHRHLALRVMNSYHVPASICMAQAILETGSGEGELAVYANNHFSIKCKSEWMGRTYRLADDDYDDQGNLLQSCFRKYNSVEESFMDYGNFLATRSFYAPVFQENSITDYIGWANGLQNAGYATNPDYASSLIRIIEENNLMDLDKGFFTPTPQLTFAERYEAWERTQDTRIEPSQATDLVQNEELDILTEIINMGYAVQTIEPTFIPSYQNRPEGSTTPESETVEIQAVLFERSIPKKKSAYGNHKVAPIRLTNKLIR